VTTDDNKVWEAILGRLREALEPEDYRRWFSDTSQASDSGDVVGVWVTSETVRRHIMLHYQHLIAHALAALGRRDVEVRFIATGYTDDDEEM
jgi:chromosomal replication initiation ATPase DnaA